MNIIVKPYGSRYCCCRPDTTWERENRDFYSPECVNEIRLAPVIFARVSKAGKCIGEKFAERYFDGIGCGMLMYCSGPDTDDSIAFTSCIDHTSILPHPLYSPDLLDEDRAYNVSVDGTAKTISLDDAKSMLKDAICKASQLTSLRIGDFVAVELAPLGDPIRREDGDTAIKGNFCDKDIFDYKIIF